MKVRSDILRVYQSVHIWTGIISGMVLFIGFYAGSLTMFKETINQWITPPSHNLPVASALDYNQLIAKATEQHDKARQGFTLYFEQVQKPPMQWYEQGTDRGLNLDGIVQQASLTDHNELITQQVKPSALADLVDELHRTAGIPGTLGHEGLGEYILGIASVLYFLALVSGVIFLLPTLVKSLFSFRQNKTASRFWLDSHNAVGILSLPFHIVISLTVIVFAFHDQFYHGLEEIVYGEQPMFSRPAPAKIEYSYTNLPQVEDIQAIAKTIAPDYQFSEMAYLNLNTPRATVRLGAYNPNELMRGPVTDYIFIQPYTGTILSSTLNPADEGIWVRLVASFFALHFGSYGGELGRWVYFFLGIMGAFLFYSGNLLWLEKRRNKKTQQQTKNVRWLANATVGICLGSMLAVAVTFVSAKWISLFASQINFAYMWVYYLVFFAAVIGAFIYGAAKSAVWILNLLALACLALPIISLLGIIFPQSGIWPSIHLTTIGLELVALSLAGLFAFLARKTKQRYQSGEQNSIWFNTQAAG
ncbi:PepSY domain-containing protein [Catenovulum sp. 2E275]|uniref:PepSY-associated TM helix domain-containing protein n=1 Tax=Catenovulum sp. 2E275 TaxID=2980497 RepID=UPI0021D23CA4|nr:PepSY-associated TM helix domain-containing protein [Catenovulum sp. 2E275]MCU4675221.1 PepSY domain-containing protein [Catenovulum sp. 2E275]